MSSPAFTSTSILELGSARLKIYQFLYLLFSAHLTEDTLKELREKGGLEELALLNDGGAKISGFLMTCTPDQLKEQQHEYTSLFVGPGICKAPLWESYYTSKERILFGESTLEVRKAFRDFRLAFIDENRYPEDHLLLEFEFMMFLINKMGKENDLAALSFLYEKQMEFLELHLGKWIPLFCERVAANTDSQLYSGAAKLLQEFIIFEIDLLRELKEEIG